MTEQLNSFGDFLKWETSTRDTIDVKCVYIDMAGGDHVAGILLSQIVYWHLPSRLDDRTKLRVKKEGNLWLAKGRADWFEETRITPRQFDRASNILVDLGIIEKKVFKFSGNPTVHVRIIQAAFLESLQAHMEAALAATLQAEDEFAKDADVLISMREDSNEEPVSARNYLESENSNSPIGDNHNIEEDVFSSSLRSEEKTLSTGEEKPDTCSLCGKYPPTKLSVDKGGRCALCLFTDAWSYFIGKRVPRYTTDDNLKRTYSGIENTRYIQIKMKARLKDESFRRGWVFALERAGRMEHLKTSGWFNPDYFLRNENNWKKIVEGTFDSFEEQNHPASYASLQSWLARRRAGLAE